MWDLIIIGNGIAAQCFLWELSKSEKRLSVLKISDHKLAPPCSLNSTSLISLKGNKKGISTLGDEIFDSYQMAEAFIKFENPQGVVPAKFYSIWEVDEKDEFLRRFGALDEIDRVGAFSLKVSHFGKIWDGYIFEPAKFLKFMEEKTKSTHSSVSGMVVGSEIGEDFVSITTLDGKTFKGKKLLICSGAYTKLYEALYPVHDSIKKSSSVPGAFLLKKGCDFGDDSFVISFQEKSLIYDGLNKILKIGSTTQKNGIEIPDFKSLEKIWGNFQNILKEEIPAISDFEIRVGIRQKGPKRMPFSGKISKNVYAIINLYKNGYIFPFKMAQDMLKIM